MGGSEVAFEGRAISAEPLIAPEEADPDWITPATLQGAWVGGGDEDGEVVVGEFGLGGDPVHGRMVSALARSRLICL